MDLPLNHHNFAATKKTCQLAKMKTETKPMQNADAEIRSQPTSFAESFIQPNAQRDSKQCVPTALQCYPSEEKRAKVMVKEKEKAKEEKAKEKARENFCWPKERAKDTEREKDMEKEREKEKAKEISAKLTARSFAKMRRCSVTPRPAKQAAAAIGTLGKRARLHSTVKAVVGVILALKFAPISMRVNYNRKLNTTHSNSANLQDLVQDLDSVLSAKTHSKIHLIKTHST